MDITLNSIKIRYILVDFVFIYWKHILTHWFQCILYFYNKKPTDGDVVQLSKNEVAWVQPMLPVKGQGRMWICRMDNFTKIYMLILWVLKEQEKKCMFNFLCPSQILGQWRRWNILFSISTLLLCLRTPTVYYYIFSSSQKHLSERPAGSSGFPMPSWEGHTFSHTSSIASSHYPVF